ncbi:hypothetical protein [Enterovirga sp.]|uniref:alginate O-acetyltransferase AlgX-related protein n=1 Tax=Enterovirga sp. TaxID=2026350 RepID=UPI002630D575|nr:hypothetical protein [Enterovirga sp.]MDB5590089.1 hypothetical protein [Enterovirga sp.]
MARDEAGGAVNSAAADFGVCEGRDGWLFLVGGNNDVAAQFRETELTTNLVQMWRQAVIARLRRARRLGMAYRHIVVPEKLTVYDDRLPELGIDVRLSPFVRLRASFFRRPAVWRGPRAFADAVLGRRACLDLVGAMRARRSAEDLYFRTDTHWTLPGVRVAYRALCRALGARPRRDFVERPCREMEFAGDLGTKFEPHRTERVRRYSLQRDAVRIYANPIVEARETLGQADTLHGGSHMVYRNEAPDADPRRIVLFGDSQAQTGLTIMLAETFREVHFIWSPAVDWGYVERVRPDVLLTEIAERFMMQLPDDTFDLDSYVQRRFGEELAAWERLRAGPDALRPVPPPPATEVGWTLRTP